jgi:hypothetical protein
VQCNRPSQLAEVGSCAPLCDNDDSFSDFVIRAFSSSRKPRLGATRVLPCCLALLVLAAAAYFGLARGWAQAATSNTPATLADQLSTEEHLNKPGWWPTKGTFPREEFVGNQVCAKCHAAIVAEQKQSAMALTATRAADAKWLRANSLDYTLGPFTYKASASGDIASYTVAGQERTVSGPLSWSFGIRMGQSYFFEHEGHTYLVPLTYYPEPKLYTFTVDQPHTVPVSLEKAVGRALTDNEIRGCFNCHTTGATVKGQFDPDHAVPGVTCEACHGPGANHVAAAKGGLAEQGNTMIFNPGQLGPVQSVDFCGSCHRTWWDVTLAQDKGPRSLRFPAYRLENSKCWGKGDARLACIACHSPHQPLVREAAAYDVRCLSCHVTKVGEKPTADHPGKACPTATKNCVTCHMPQYKVVDIPVKFTDHQIRVVREADAIPQ